MIGFALHAALSGSGVELASEAGRAGSTTERWRDKSRRCAAWCGRVFSEAYGALARGAPDRRSLRIRHFAKDYRAIARCAGPRP